MRYGFMLLSLGLAGALNVTQAPPPDLAALVAKARLDAPVAAWCRAEFQAGRRGAFAVAVTSASGGGRYVALQADGHAVELAAFKETPNLACYGRAEARTLGRSLQQSADIVQGNLAPRWNTTVVCGFIDNTSAECWQYSPDARAFVSVGRWVT